MNSRDRIRANLQEIHHLTQQEIYQGELNSGAEPGKTPKGWSGSGNLISGDINTVVALQAQFPQPGNYTVQFGTMFPPAVAQLDILQAEALVTWSVAGNSLARRITVVNGASITGSAEAVSVVVSDVSNVLGLGGIPYNIAVNVCEGVRANIQRPPVFYPAGALGVNPLLLVAHSFDVDVPQNAGVISVQVTICDTSGAVIPDNAVIVTQFALPSNSARRVCDPRDLEWIPLAPGVTKIRVSNVTNANAVFVNVSFGVDG